MKKITIAVAVVLTCAVIIAIFRQPIKEFVYAVVTEDMFVSVDDDNFDPGPSIGSTMPAISALFEDKEISNIDSFAGEKGTILIASRSLDWCPYCMKQLIQLQQNKALFDEAGLGLVAMTYDEPTLQQAFVTAHSIEIPLLSDINGKSFKALGILNAKYTERDDRYGLPHPGMIILNSEGAVVGKLFVQAYSARVDAKSSLIYALLKLD